MVAGDELGFLTTWFLEEESIQNLVESDDASTSSEASSVDESQGVGKADQPKHFRQFSRRYNQRG